MSKQIKISLIVLLSIILVLLSSLFVTGSERDLIRYVSGKYGTKCYLLGQEHGNIEYQIEFDSLDGCLEYVKNNKANGH